MRPCRCPARQWPRRAAQNWPTGTGFPCCPQGTACQDSSGSWPVDLTVDSYLGHPCFSLLVPPVVPCVGVLRSVDSNSELTSRLDIVYRLLLVTNITL